MIGRTGIYRVRKGLLGKCILQYQSRSLRSDAAGGGYEFIWNDRAMKAIPDLVEALEAIINANVLQIAAPAEYKKALDALAKAKGGI